MSVLLKLKCRQSWHKCAHKRRLRASEFSSRTWRHGMAWPATLDQATRRPHHDVRRRRARVSGEIMITKGNLILCRVTMVILATLLAACGSGPSESEFVAACLKEGERNVANKALRKEAGVKGDAFCKCAA